MGKIDISVKVNYPKDEESSKELLYRIASIEIGILREKYGDIVTDKFINSERE